MAEEFLSSGRLAGGELPREEGERVEFREQWTETAKKTLVAFVNGAGGTVWFGINGRGEAAGLSESPDSLRRSVSSFAILGRSVSGPSGFARVDASVSGQPQVGPELGNRVGKGLAFADENGAGHFFAELRRACDHFGRGSCGSRIIAIKMPLNWFGLQMD